MTEDLKSRLDEVRELLETCVNEGLPCGAAILVSRDQIEDAITRLKELLK